MSNRDKKRMNSEYQRISKAMEEVSAVDKQSARARLKVRARCPHAKMPGTPELVRKNTSDGKVEWYCRNCGEKVNLERISDDDLKKAIQTVNDAANIVKIMAKSGDSRLVEAMADIQIKTSSLLFNAYKQALNSTSKNRKRSTRTTVSWGE